MQVTRIVVPAAIMLALATGNGSAQTVKIGVINTFSGPTAQQGEMLEKGLQLYYKLHQKDLPSGVKIELVERDDTGAVPETAKRLAQELVTRDHVQILTGFVWSPKFMSVAPVATEHLVPDEELQDIGDHAIGLVTSGIYTADATRPASLQSSPPGKRNTA